MLYAAKHFHKFYPQRQQARPFRQTFFLVWVRVKRIASSLRLEHADDDDAAAVAVAAEALQTHTHAVLCAANSSYRVQTIVCVLPVPLPAERLYTRSKANLLAAISIILLLPPNNKHTAQLFPSPSWESSNGGFVSCTSRIHFCLVWLVGIMFTSGKVLEGVAML